MSDKYNEHPLDFLLQLPKIFKGSEFDFELSSYSYKPQSADDSRKVYRVDAEKLIEEFESIRLTLPGETEIAVHSRVFIDEKIYHFPMADLIGKLNQSNIQNVVECFKYFKSKSIMLYDSGRSEHIYGLSLIDHHNWLAFMGRLLLLNLPGQNPIIDSRWVGHRLIGGYGSLRLTNFSKQYYKIPTLIEQIQLF